MDMFIAEAKEISDLMNAVAGSKKSLPKFASMLLDQRSPEQIDKVLQFALGSYKCSECQNEHWMLMVLRNDEKWDGFDNHFFIKIVRQPGIVQAMEALCGMEGDRNIH